MRDLSLITLEIKGTNAKLLNRAKITLSTAL
jgi:hypothetical protein